MIARASRIAARLRNVLASSLLFALVELLLLNLSLLVRLACLPIQSELVLGCWQVGDKGLGCGVERRGATVEQLLTGSF